jgi:hypothetical protein
MERGAVMGGGLSSHAKPGTMRGMMDGVAVMRTA